MWALVSIAPIRQASRLSARVAFVQHSCSFDGSTISGLLAAEAMVNAGCTVDVVFGFEGPFAERYAVVGCQTHVIRHGEWLRGGNVIRSTRRLASEALAARAFSQLFRKGPPDLVYINSLVSLAPALAARTLGIPCIWHVRELFDDVGGEMHAPALGGRRLVRLALRRLAGKVVCISRSVAANVLGDPQRFEMALVPNAVADTYFDAPAARQESLRRLSLPDGVPIVGVPGTLRPVKGHSFFFEAAAAVLRERPDCLFAVTGDGAPAFRAQQIATVARLGLRARVRFLGTVVDMQAFYGACDVVCVPSRSESFGRTVIEAFAVGTPVIATAVGGIRETVDHERTGLLIEYGDVSALAGGILRLLADQSLRMRLADAAQKKAYAEYRADTYRRRIVEIVSKVAGLEAATDDARVFPAKAGAR